jgi:formylglycine-generating enzyme
LKRQIPTTDWVCPDGVGMEDLLYIAAHWLAETPEGVGSADLNWDGKVDLSDFALFTGQWMTEENYTLNVNSYGALGVDISSSTGHGGTTNYTQTLTSGTTVTLSAPAKAGGGVFEGWTGDINSTNQTISFLMDTNKTVTANYSSGIIWVSINDPGVPGHEGFNGQMSRYETTNAQYCQFLNSALLSGDITVSGSTVYGASGSNNGADFPGQIYYDLAGSGFSYNFAVNGGAARIHLNGSSFTVDIGYEDHPVTYVSWYGATAFCNYYGYRLPTQWEWAAVADYDGSFTYGCGLSINTDRKSTRLNSSHDCSLL